MDLFGKFEECEKKSENRCSLSEFTLFLPFQKKNYSDEARKLARRNGCLSMSTASFMNLFSFTATLTHNCDKLKVSNMT